MRIVVTLPWGERLGGAEAMLHTILGEASQLPHEVEPVFFQDGPWAEELRGLGFRVEVIPAGHLRELHRWTATVVRLSRLLRRRRPDLVLNWAPKTHLYGAPAAVLAGIGDRVVWWQQAIPDGFWLDRLATRLPARAILCYSEAAAEAQRLLPPVRPTYPIAAGTPIPQPAVEPADLELPADVPVVGIVGRLQPWKGQDRLLQAQAMLRDRGRRMHLLIVGGDAYGLSADYAAELPRLIERLGLSQDVTMTGQVPDAGPYIERMDVLVNASDPEPFGIVLLEGMARGVAVMAVASGGPAEFVEDGSTGVLASSGSPAALAEALERLLAAPELRRSVAEAGRARFLEQFTDVALRRRFFARMESVLDGPEAAPGRETVGAAR